MGHERLGGLPRTRRWEEVIDLISGTGDAAAVASATLDAIERELAGAADDPAFVRAVWLLTQLPDAARGEDYENVLRSLGLPVDATPTKTELAAAFTYAVDAHVQRVRGRTDVGELAQLAAVETLAGHLNRQAGLFGTQADETQSEIASLGTEKRFGTLARDFFARFTERVLGAFVSRELPLHVGPDRRFASLEDQRSFNEALRLHCQQASRIVETFAGSWYSKARYEKELTEPRTARFIGYALTKLKRELRAGAAA